MIRKQLLFRPNLLKPDITLPSIHDISADMLRERSIHCLVFDVDHTLAYHGSSEIDTSTVAHVQSLRARANVSIYIASNSRRNLKRIGQQLDAKIIRATLFSRKPRRPHFERIVRETGFSANATAMVGDKLWTDVLGGNLAGMTTIWVLSGKQKFFSHERN